MDKTISVRLLNRDFALRVREGDEAFTRRMATYVADKLEAFKQAHPDQADTTAAVITALALAEELFEQRDAYAALQQAVEDELDAATGDLEAVLNRR